MTSPIDVIHLSQYANIGAQARRWAFSIEPVPKSVLPRIRGIRPTATLYETLFTMREAVLATAGMRSRQARTKAESRLTRFEDAVAVGMFSCGSMTRMFGVMLRHHGVPVRFVDGTYVLDDKPLGHAWLDIYDPRDDGWLEFDPVQHRLVEGERHARREVFHDWEQMHVTVGMQ